MDTKCATSYTNIFMGWFGEKFIFPLLTNLKDLHLRFRDNIFLMWNKTKSESDNFFNKNNECYHTIKLECEINFLDTAVFKIDNQQRKFKIIYTANQNILTPLRKVCL